MNERERFEAWAIRKETGFAVGDLRRKDDDDYANADVDLCWEGWQAALADRPEPAQLVGAVSFAQEHGIEWNEIGLRGLPNETKLYVAPVDRPPAQPDVELLQQRCAEAYQLAGLVGAPLKWLDALSDAANGEPGARFIGDLLPIAFEDLDAFPAPQEPAQPMAQDIGKLYGVATLLSSFGAIETAKEIAALADRLSAPPSHPAPSEAAPERQEQEAIAALKAWLRCTPGTVGWADLRYDARVIALLGDDRAQPAKGEGK